MTIKDERQTAAKFLIDVILNKITVLEALKNFPKDSIDPSVRVCFHILTHYDADEDIRKKDPLYKETQDEFIVNTAEVLLKGETLPQNIIDEYKNFYGDDLFYKKNSKENIIERLKRSINL